MVKKDCRLWRPPSLKSCLIYECSILFDILLPKIGPYPVVTAMQYKNIKNNKQKKCIFIQLKYFLPIAVGYTHLDLNIQNQAAFILPSSVP